MGDMLYGELSAYQRDVVQVLLQAQSPLTGKTIKKAVAEIRDAPETPYTYQVLKKLVGNDWVEERPDAIDDRVNRYTVTPEARSAIKGRIERLNDVEPASIESHSGTEVTDGLTYTLLEASPDSVPDEAGT